MIFLPSSYRVIFHRAAFSLVTLVAHRDIREIVSQFLDARYSCEKNYHTNGRRLSKHARDTRVIHRRAILPSAQVRSTLIAPRKRYFPGGRGGRRRGEEAARICGVYKSSSFECSERSSNTYCLLAVAAQLTSLGTPSPSFRLMAKGLKTTGRLGRESNSFPSQSRF